MTDITLPPDTLDKMKDASSKMKRLEVFIRKARNAGIAVDQHETRLNMLREQIRKLQTGFFPNETL